MIRICLALCFCLAASLLTANAFAQDHPFAATQQTARLPTPIKHGGKIESKYDGFAYETIVALDKMKVTCRDARSIKAAFKDSCVSFAVSLHLPGQQLDFVRQAKLRLFFETKDWDARHASNERDLTVVADGESFKVGTMALVKQDVGGGLTDGVMSEVLEVSLPYQTFGKIARAQSIEMKVGPTAFGLKEKNVAALRDLQGRVKQ
ncbi:MAG: hypothetical protein ACRD9R_01280 [Pyrinomonadaceae bacterium]